eukprot:gene13080-13207_t
MGSIQQVLELTQLTRLDLDWRCWPVWRCMKDISAEALLDMIAKSMRRLQVLCILAYHEQQEHLMTIFGQDSWLPELKQLVLYRCWPPLLEEFEPDYEPIEDQYMDELVATVEQARPDLQVSWRED